jgi:hypothetical protein
MVDDDGKGMKRVYSIVTLFPFNTQSTFSSSRHHLGIAFYSLVSYDWT